MSLANALKTYFEETIKTDPALKEVYDEAKLNDCANYVTAQAKKMAVNNCAVVENSVVYHWARDFYYGDVSELPKEEVKAEVIETEVKEVAVVKEKKTAKKKQAKKEPWEIAWEQVSLFDDLPPEERGGA